MAAQKPESQPASQPGHRPGSDSAAIPADAAERESLPALAEAIAEIAAAQPPDEPQPSSAGKLDPADPIIAFRDVSISFDGRAVLKNVNFHVDRGQTLCILGRSGVGKSVSLRMLMGFLQPDSGSIHVEGREIVGLSEPEMMTIRKRVTMVFQNGALFDSLSVRENVSFPLRERGGLDDDQVHLLVDRLIGLVGAEDVVDALPSSLSTGRKRAVAMARALAAQPEVVLYDEPTTMVDPIIARRLGDLIQRLKHQLGFTSIVVTHDMRFAERLADTVLFLDGGEAKFFGTLKEFLASTEPHIQQFLTLDAYVFPQA